MEPFKGAIVNYHCIHGEEYLGCGEDKVLPAIITGIVGGTMRAVDLTIFTRNSSSLLTIRTSVAYGLTNGGGWTWPQGVNGAGNPPVYKDTEVTKVAPNPLTVNRLAPPVLKVG